MASALNYGEECCWFKVGGNPLPTQDLLSRQVPDYIREDKGCRSIRLGSTFHIPHLRHGEPLMLKVLTATRLWDIFIFV